MLKLKGRKRLKASKTMDAAEWNVCYDGWTPQAACTVTGWHCGEWTFEDGMAAQAVQHAFDPTERWQSASTSRRAPVT